MVVFKAGDSLYNKIGSHAKVLRCKSSTEVCVRFENTGYETVITNRQIKEKSFRDRFEPSVYGVGYLGEGATTRKGRKHTRSYKIWAGMLRRCYNPKSYIKAPTYKDCSVEPSWHNFKTFDTWYKKNYPKDAEDVLYQLDKDILYRGNKIYGEDYCVFVPDYLNSLLIDSGNIRGNLPIGVSLCGKGVNKYRVRYSVNSKMVHGGVFPTPKEAFLVYKKAKEAHVKEVALEALNKEHIDRRVYEVLLKFEVIDDTI